MAEKPEAKIVREILTWLNNQDGIRAIKLHGSIFSGKGEPDVHATVKVLMPNGSAFGHSLWLEVKQPNHRPTGIQKWCQSEWQKAGAISTTVTSLQEVMNLVVSLHKKAKGVSDVSRANRRRV